MKWGMKWGTFEIDGLILLIAMILSSSVFYIFIKALPQIITALQACSGG